MQESLRGGIDFLHGGGEGAERNTEQTPRQAKGARGPKVEAGISATNQTSAGLRPKSLPDLSFGWKQASVLS